MVTQYCTHRGRVIGIGRQRRGGDGDVVHLDQGDGYGRRSGVAVSQHEHVRGEQVVQLLVDIVLQLQERFCKDF